MWVLFVVLLVLDRIGKWLFGNVVNSGAIFGIFKGLNLLFIILGLVVFAFILYCLRREKRMGLELIILLAGIAGNLIDRIIYGGVIDFIDIGFWPVFNLADVYLVVGVALLIRKSFK